MPKKIKAIQKHPTKMYAALILMIILCSASAAFAAAPPCITGGPEDKAVEEALSGGKPPNADVIISGDIKIDVMKVCGEYAQAMVIQPHESVEHENAEIAYSEENKRQMGRSRYRDGC